MTADKALRDGENALQHLVSRVEMRAVEDTRDADIWREVNDYRELVAEHTPFCADSQFAHRRLRFAALALCEARTILAAHGPRGQVGALCEASRMAILEARLFACEATKEIL